MYCALCDLYFVHLADYTHQASKIKPLKIVKTGAEASAVPVPSNSAPEQVQETTPLSEDVGTTFPSNESYNQEAISSGVPQLPIPDGKQIYPWLVGRFETKY